MQTRLAISRRLSLRFDVASSQGMHEDAAKAYLVTLERNPNANHVWSYLRFVALVGWLSTISFPRRISLSHMNREDLVELSHVSGSERCDCAYRWVRADKR